MMDLPPTVQIWMCEANEGNSDRDIYSRGYGATDGPDDRMDRWWEAFGNKKSNQALKELAIAMGFAAAAQPDKAIEHGIEALRYQTEAVMDASQELYDSAKDFFSRD